MEGESLLNDASGITLFTIFLSKVEDVIHHVPSHDTFWSVLGNIVGRTCWLAFGKPSRSHVLLLNACWLGFGKPWNSHLLLSRKGAAPVAAVKDLGLPC